MRVLIGAQTILSITVKFHALRMRRAKSVQTIGFILKPVGANSVRPQNAKFKKQTPRLYVILSERQRDEVLVVQQSGTDKTKRLGAQGSTK